MPGTIPIDREWVAAELVKSLDVEKSLAASAEGRAESPPEEGLSVLYHEIAEADERHARAIETVATRYGHTPGRAPSGKVGKVWDQIKDKVGKLAAGPLDQLAADLDGKAHAIHRLVAWSKALAALGDADGAREISAVLAEEQAHRDALQDAFDRLLLRRCTEVEEPAKEEAPKAEPAIEAIPAPAPTPAPAT
ncbi:hypothetical protein OJF2_03650 [Aquisphaera giovannonii]|uniref:Uncharacterized protein n=1 Tax=Aquisphaera giovannonii TaxID=406548 RepID=A0A5B9VUG3_9BACT|nr:hypothetical protein [Aquisphaera giovannonii]QEH31898.1 hypothetical protein OJF2_03650 [Aquisphaera giovannonii]